MNFYRWSFDEPLLINDYGIPEPISKKKVYPEILLIPLMGFDNEFNRLGYGGGFYDRYLAKKGNSKKILKIGVGFSLQKVSKIPTNQHDVSLDNIITEKNLLMRILFLGDVVGISGCSKIFENLKSEIQKKN